MIVIYLSGGLGNQMFQYALGRHLSYINKTELKLDVFGFEHDERYDYSLEVFDMPQVFASSEEIEELTAYNPSILERLINRLASRKKRSKTHYVENKRTGFEPEVFKITPNVYLTGYWQSEKYFSEIEGIIRKDFSFKPGVLGDFKGIDSRMAETNSISVHIRRGDYVNDSKVHKAHGICSLDYYRNCVNDIAGKVSDPCFYIFSNDPQWVLDNLSIDFPKVVVGEGGNFKDYEDMHLMSCCKHNIIANSSFSWWGAWLNTNNDKMVYAPEQWFLKKDWNYQDIVPPQWKRVQG